MTPTTSPRVLVTGVSRNASRSSSRPSAGPIARYAPSSALRAMPRPSSAAAQKSPSAPPFAIHPPRRIRSVSTAPLEPPTSSGLACIARRMRCGVRVSSAAAWLRVTANVGTPQPSTPTAVRADQLGDPLLQRMARVAVRVERPPVSAAGGEHACMLAGAVVAELPVGSALLQPVLEVVDRRRRRGRAPCARRRAGRARRGARHTRSPARRRRGRRSPRETESPGSASTTSAGSTRARDRRSSRRRWSRRGRGAPPRRPRRASPEP